MKTTFGYDLEFLREHDSVIVLELGTSKLIVSPKYQGKVFTSTNAGDRGPSFGWIHYKAFDGPIDPHMNAYGGENRLWLGPEYANWESPAALETEPWDVTGLCSRTVSLKKNMQLTNYEGTDLQLSVSRHITLLDRSSIDSLLSLPSDPSVQTVGYTTVNTLTNTGDEAWTEATGMPCLGLLDMFKSSLSTVVVIPYTDDFDSYFGEIPADRIRYAENTLFFRADGKSRGKWDIHPCRAKRVMGSYDAEHGLLTITQFDVGIGARHLNQKWTVDGSQLGPFYELESASPAAALAPGGLQIYNHSVFHFTGAETALDKICRRTLGMPVETIKMAFSN